MNEHKKNGLEDVSRETKSGIRQSLENLVDFAYRSGANAKVISAIDIVVEENLAKLCKKPQCDNYGLSASCPPHVSGPSGFRKLQRKCKYAIVIKFDVQSTALFSNERNDIMKLLHEVVAGIEHEAVKMGYLGSKAFAGGSCKKIFCQDHVFCRLVSDDGKCRNSRYARPSMSGFGINVSELMHSAGWPAEINVRETDHDQESMTWVAGLVMIC